MDPETENDMAFVLSVLMDFFPGGARADVWVEETGNTVEELDAAMKRLGKQCGIDAGLL